jgi:hypothetical protein
VIKDIERRRKEIFIFTVWSEKGNGLMFVIHLMIFFFFRLNVCSHLERDSSSSSPALHTCVK